MSRYSEGTTSGSMEDEDLEKNNEKTAMVRKKSEEVVVVGSNNNGGSEMLRNFMTNLQAVFLGTKLAVLFPAVPLAVVATFYGFGRVSAHSCKLYFSFLIIFYSFCTVICICSSANTSSFN